MKKLTSFLTILALSVFNSYADDGGLPIDTGGGNGGGNGGNGGKPQAPARRIVNCYLEDGELIITSQSSAVGEVIIYDQTTGDVVLHTFTSFMPQYTVDLSALTGYYTMVINISGYSYQYAIDL